MIGFHPELLIALAVILLIFGPKKLPQMGSAIGKTIKEFRKGTKDLGEPTEEEASQQDRLAAPKEAFEEVR